MESSLVPSPARVNAWSLTSPASRVTNCRRHPTAARRRRRWELAKVACNTIQKCHNKCDMTQGTLILVKVSKIFKCTDWLKIRFWIFLWILDSSLWNIKRQCYFNNGTVSYWEHHIPTVYKIEILTQRWGTSEVRLTWRGANMWSCCRQVMASAWTRESGWSCMMAQHTRQYILAVAIALLLPAADTHTIRYTKHIISIISRIICILRQYYRNCDNVIPTL